MASDLKKEEIADFLDQLPNWKIIEDHHLESDYSFKNFKQALDFVNQVGKIAEECNHHPDIYFTWGKVKLKIMTHSVDGLTKADFVLATHISKIK